MERVADVLADTLIEFGVDVVFGLPGGENVEVVEALRLKGIRFVLVHNESSAVFMADATARLTGKPGVCLTALGPGATNAVAGVAHAYLDRAPVLVMTAQAPERMRQQHTHQIIDLTALYMPITKRSIELTAADVRQSVRHALELTQSGRPGPVHLQITNDIAGQPTTEKITVPIHKESKRHSANDFGAANKIISNSRRPAIVVGLGLEPERPYESLLALVQSARAPIISTPKAKGCVPDDHPLAAGTFGLTRSDPAYEILDQADCIIAIGFDVVELVKPWDQSAPLIWIAPWENRDPILATQAEFVGPMAPTLQELARMNWHTSADWGEKIVASHREKLTSRKLPAPAVGRMLPQSVLEALREAAPSDTILTTDVGSHKILACLTWPTFTPNSFLVSNGLSCMGFALPASIAASLAQPSRKVVCTIGDAGMAMVMGELGVLARLETLVIVVVFNDGALDLIRLQQLRAGKPVYGTEFNNPDLVRIAEAYGIEAVRVQDKDECFQQVAAAIRRGRPKLIEAMIDPIGYSTLFS